MTASGNLVHISMDASFNTQGDLGGTTIGCGRANAWLLVNRGTGHEEPPFMVSDEAPDCVRCVRSYRSRLRIAEMVLEGYSW